MTQKDIHMPPEVHHFINERTKIWAEMDAARSHAGQLDQYSQKIGGVSGQAIDVSIPFTKTGNPSDEITAIVSEINKQMKQVDDLDREVNATQTQIANIKQRAQSMTILLIVGIIIVIGIAGFVILSIIN